MHLKEKRKADVENPSIHKFSPKPQTHKTQNPKADASFSCSPAGSKDGASWDMMVTFLWVTAVSLLG